MGKINVNFDKMFGGFNPTEEEMQPVINKTVEENKDESKKVDAIEKIVVDKTEQPKKDKKVVSKKDEANEIIKTMVQDDFKIAITDYCLANELSENDLVLKCADKILERGTLSKERIADKISGKTKSVYGRCSKEYKIEFMRLCNKLGKSMGYVLSQEIAKVISYN